jgi:hypothetical protein
MTSSSRLAMLAAGEICGTRTLRALSDRAAWVSTLRTETAGFLADVVRASGS